MRSTSGILTNTTIDRREQFKRGGSCLISNQFFQRAILLILIIPVGCIGLQLFAEEIPDKKVQVSVKLNTWYDDSAKSLKEIRSFVDFFPPEPTQVLKREDINHLVIRRYGFGPSQLPKTYNLLVHRLYELNNLHRDDEPIQRSSLLAPPLPKRAVLFPRHDNPYNAFPQMSSYVAFLVLNANAIVQKSSADDAFRKGSRSMVLTFDLDRSYVTARRGADIFKSPDFRVTSEPVKVNMQPASCGAAPNARTFPDMDTKTEVMSMLGRQFKRNAYVFVLDSGWPDEPAYSETLSLFENTLAVLRSQSGLAPFQRTKAKQFNPLDPARSSTHALKVAESLKDLRAWDTEHRVRVIFVPLGLGQGDDDFFRNLLGTYFAYTWTHSLDAQVPKGRELEEPVLQQSAADYASGVIDRMRLLGAKGGFYTNNAIIEAVYMVGDAVGEFQNTFYFVNESWSIDGALLKFAMPPRPRGITVVAPGNDDSDFVAKAIDFAQQALTNDYYVAVMNISSEGRIQCHSSIGDENRISDLRVLGFDGNLVDDSGTSFAAPRVAWILALKETTTPAPALAYWATDVIRAVKAARKIDQPKWRNVWFDIHNYFSHQ